MKEQTILVAIAVVAYCLGVAMALTVTYFGYVIRGERAERKGNGVVGSAAGVVVGSAVGGAVATFSNMGALNRLAGRKGGTGTVTGAEKWTAGCGEHFVRTIEGKLLFGLGVGIGDISDAIARGEYTVKKRECGGAEFLVKTARKTVVVEVGVR